MLRKLSLQLIVFRKNQYLFLIGTNLLFKVSIAIHAKKEAFRKLPVIGANTKSFTAKPPYLAIIKAINDERYVQSSKVEIYFALLWNPCFQNQYLSIKLE